VKDGVPLPAITAFRLLAADCALGRRNPILLKDCLGFDTVPSSPDIALLPASVVIGRAAGRRHRRCHSGARRIRRGPVPAAGLQHPPGRRLPLSFKTDYVACPSCGRTLFNLQTVTARIKARTDHLKGVKIAIMGCIVNGPGEMADADFGYVGGAPGQDQPLRRQDRREVQHSRETEAVDRLVDLIASTASGSDVSGRQMASGGCGACSRTLRL
jgi:(E)-4-hydroxy-3-methylbut-2-enyl-diphosphate synthase